MNARTRRLLLEMLLAIVVSVGLECAIHYMTLPYLAFTLLPLIWLALRHGSPTAVVAATFSGVMSGVITMGTNDIFQFILIGILPLLSVGIAGFFAKYTQKTLNNRRLSSTYLNIVTATILVVLLSYAIRFVLSPLALNQPIELMSNWLGLVLTIVMISGILCIIAKTKPESIIPKRSKYLSRKETSILLND